MYLSFYNLVEEPFSITPDPRFLFFTGHHREAFDHLIYGITRRRGFIQLTGEVGSGKTTLCRAVLNHLNQSVQTALVLNPLLSFEQLLRSILNDLGLADPGNDRLDCIQALNHFLLSRGQDDRTVAVLIDEAQNLSPEMMEQIRLLSNLETDQQKLVQIVLCGQPELKSRLAGPELRQLRQRITVRYHLLPLSLEQVAGYIDHRLQVAGADAGLRFTPQAVRAVYRYARGCPRMINAICDNAMLAGFVARSWTIDVNCVRRANRQLKGGT